MWDVAIVGAGPAGSAAALAALTAAPQARVLLLDRDNFPRDKACGDGIAPHALDVLKRLGVPDAVGGFAPVHMLQVGFAAGPQVAGAMRRPAYVVPRAVFDARLARAAVERGATLVRHRVRELRQAQEGVVLDGTFSARVVVAADGANSHVRRLVDLPRTPRRHVAVAIRGYAPEPSMHPARQVIAFDEGCGWPAYAWSFPIGDGHANVGYGQVLREGRAPGRSDLIGRLEALLPDVAAEATRWRGHQLPLSSGRPRQPNGRVLFAGDALSLINPLTGEGIFYAVRSGELAGRAAVGGSAAAAGALYRSAVRRDLGRHLRQTTAAAWLATRRRLVERTLGAAADPRFFADLVELGLGSGTLTSRMVVELLRS
jgi:geranylgeranyl reductase family protein